MKNISKKKIIIIAVVIVILLLPAMAGGDDTETVEAAPVETESTAGIEEQGTDYHEYGEQLSVIDNGDGVCILKYKVQSQLTNALTIEQNYYNVCNFVTSGQADGFQELQYWAVADTQDGQDTKIISFTVPADVIESIKSGNTLPNAIEDELSDLWVLPSLLN
jgi:hypothetical protein